MNPMSVNLQIDKFMLPRQNLLGDLKATARISQAQVGLRRGLGTVREFARKVVTVTVTVRFAFKFSGFSSDLTLSLIFQN